ncbi:hypothetical protein GQ44DRAFT_349405 [Phaeosphaeriaceae sp. PMI808]|nr:hypothetical protein GQ44DRAFT_349405 [Phaeosphaeriaceae sp. PMI808]
MANRGNGTFTCTGQITFLTCPSPDNSIPFARRTTVSYLFWGFRSPAEYASFSLHKLYRSSLLTLPQPHACNDQLGEKINRAHYNISPRQWQTNNVVIIYISSHTLDAGASLVLFFSNKSTASPNLLDNGYLPIILKSNQPSSFQQRAHRTNQHDHPLHPHAGAPIHLLRLSHAPSTSRITPNRSL